MNVINAKVIGPIRIPLLKSSDISNLCAQFESCESVQISPPKPIDGIKNILNISLYHSHGQLFVGC